MGRIVDVSEVLLELGLSGSSTEEERALASVAVVKAEGDVKRYLKYDPVQTSRTEYYPIVNLNQNRVGVWEANDSSAYLRRFNEAVGNELQVKHIPIRATTAIQLWIDYDGRFGTKSGSFAAATLKTEGEDYWPNYDGVDDASSAICRDGLIRSIGLWPTEPGSVKITYTAGYNDAELHGQDSLVDASPIVSAIISEAARKVKKALVNAKSDSVGWAGGPFTSESLGDYSYSIDSSTSNRLFGSSVGLTTESKEMLRDFVHWGYSL
jgi:hypothetical protein